MTPILGVDQSTMKNVLFFNYQNLNAISDTDTKQQKKVRKNTKPWIKLS